MLMSLSLAFAPSWAGHFLLAALIFLALKALAAIAQTAMMRGDYRRPPSTRFFGAVYFTGKATPALASACAFVSAVLHHDRAYAWFLGLFTIIIAFLAIHVVRLRERGRFFGVLDAVSKKRN